MKRRPPRSTLFPYAPLSRSPARHGLAVVVRAGDERRPRRPPAHVARAADPARGLVAQEDRKSTRLNSSHANISYAVFCLKKKKKRLQLPHYCPDSATDTKLR